MTALCVLVVEDEALIAEDLRTTLEGLGCEVLGPASNCEFALDLLKSVTPDIALVDTHLGSENCEAVVKECDRLGIAVVITSGLPKNELPDFCAGRDYVSKPFRDADIEEAIRAVDV
jgi:DNA-binding response OmpR family regulator